MASVEIVLTEIGIITLLGMCIGGILKAQVNSQESRCDEIKCCCIKCHRQNLTTEELVELHHFKLRQAEEAKNEDNNNNSITN